MTAQAIEKKCNFEHVILLGNYELCYSLGMLSAAAGLERKWILTRMNIILRCTKYTKMDIIEEASNNMALRK